MSRFCPLWSSSQQQPSTMQMLFCACLHTSFWICMRSNLLTAENSNLWPSLHLATALWSWSLRKRTWVGSTQLCAVRWGDRSWDRAAACNPQGGPLAEIECAIKGAHPESGLHRTDLLWHPGGATAEEGEPAGNQTLTHLHNFWMLSHTANPL